MSADTCTLRVALHRLAALSSVLLCLAVASWMAVAGPPDRGPIWADPHARGWPFRRAGPPRLSDLGDSYSLVVRGRRLGPCVEYASRPPVSENATWSATRACLTIYIHRLPIKH